MPVGAYIGTPATNAGDGTYLTNGLDRLGELSPEKSVFAQSQNMDLITQMKNARGNSRALRTPRAGDRDPLRLLPNPGAKSEFTPLMKSAAKNNMARRLAGKKFGGPETPAYLREGFSINGGTPALPKMVDNSQLQSEHTGSSAGYNNDNTLLPHNVSSSANSTPLAQLPGRDAGGVVNDGNMMTLREQENIIDKIEKENFGLKMKIHFLEEAMSKRGGEFNQAALKENTDLKVNRITMQRELHKFKKNIAQAERDAEVYRLQLEEYRERMKRRQADESVRIEIERLQTELREKEVEIERLSSKSESGSAKMSAELQNLRDEVEDLQADLREKDRLVEERDDQIDELKMKISKESNVAEELEDELENAKQQIEDLKNELDRAAEEAKAAKEEREDALDEKRKAEEDLDELRDEMANKSFTTKGLNRQLEEKAGKLEDEFEDLRERHTDLKQRYEEKSQAEKELQERLREVEKEGAAENRQVYHDLEVAQQQRDTAERKLASTTKQLQIAEQDLKVKSEEKDLLQTRHDALTSESASMQRDLSKAQDSVRDLEEAVDNERRRTAQLDNMLRTQMKSEADLLNEQIDSLHREINAKEGELATKEEDWDAQRLSLESACRKAEEKANGLQRTVEKLQDSQGTLSNKESGLQQALESEKQRHAEEEKVLNKQIEELRQDIASKRAAAETSRTEVSNAKEELRISIREQATLQEKVAELEEEIEVLQADIEQEHQFGEQQQQQAVKHVETQLQQITTEKQSLVTQITELNSELHKAKKAIRAAESDRDQIEARLHKAQQESDDTFNIDHEKRDLRRAKDKLEKDIERMRIERDNLGEANKALEEEINAEIERANSEEHRLNTEIDELRRKQTGSVDTRERELTSAKNKITRLENKIKELEEQLDHQSRLPTSPGVDVSVLRENLQDARNKEADAVKRETELKTKNRDLKTQIVALERDLHDAQLQKFKSSSRSSASPPPSNSKELAQLRQQLIDAQADLRELREMNQDLKRSARRVSVDETERADLHALLKTSTLEAENLGLKLAEREKQMAELRTQIDSLKTGNNDMDSTERADLHRMLKSSTIEAENLALKLSERESRLTEYARQIKRIRAERDSLQSGATPARLVGADPDAKALKAQLQRLRDERSIANKKADAVEHELEILQARYEAMLEKLSSGQASKDQVREKEVKGLIKQIMFLKAKCKREERLRNDLAWGKDFMEQHEVMRAQWYVFIGSLLKGKSLTMTIVTKWISGYYAKWVSMWIAASTRSLCVRSKSSVLVFLPSWRRSE
jgi:chromosome segregation ATPase